MSPAGDADGRELPLVWFGPLLEPTGFDEEGASVLLALERAGYAPVARNLRQPRGVPATTDPAAFGAVERALARPMPEGDHVFLQHALLQGRVHTRGPIAARLMYETDRLPPDWLRRLHVCDELWLTSRHALDVFAEAGIDEERLHLLPMTLDFSLYDPERAVPHELPAGARGFTFLTTFEFQDRKGWDLLLEAWVAAFDENDDVSLVLKTFSLHGDTSAEVQARLDATLADACVRHGGKRAAPVVLEPRVLAAADLPGLYAACDAFVLASRGEGWGRPYMEAMAMGLPTIGSRWSGNLAFMDDENSFLVDGALEPVRRWDARPERDWAGHRWFSADVEHLAETLRRVAQRGPEVQHRAERARSSLIEQFAPGLVADRVAELTTIALERHAERATRPVACVWRGEFGLHHSLAISNVGTSQALATELARDAQQLLRSGADSMTSAASGAPVGIAQQWPPAWHAPAAGPYVLFQPWELSRVPVAWVDRINERVDEVWVHSEHTRAAYVASGIEQERVFVIGAGVDLERFAPIGAPYALPAPAGGPDRKSTVFLWVGGLIPRKGLDVLLSSWAGAFGPNDDVCLVVKAHQTGSLYRDTATQDLLRRFAAQEGVAPVVVLSEDVGPEELASLYRAADCLVQPYRAEGFCLPALEALACGVPVIATAGGPTDAFVDDTCGWRIAATECTAPDDWLPAELLVDPALGAATMLEPDPDDLAAKLQAATDPTARNARARATRARAEEWTWERTGRVAAARVRALAGTPPRRLATPRREAVADVAARGALDDLSTAAQVDVATGAASGRKASRHHPGRPGSRGKRAKQRRANARPELPQIATGGAYSRLLEGLVATSDSATAYGFVRESATRLVAGAPTFPGRWPTGLTLVAATELTAQIERDPRQPALLAELGVTLFGLGEAAVAETVFRAILRLDPTFEHVASNLAALRAPRARAPLATDPAQRALSRLLAERAARVVAALEPETALGVSLCMIVRDEEELLEDCLASAAPWVDEIVVVDTGSTDGTRAVAARYGARIIDHPWSDSFAEARNVSIEAATGDWILWLDADERLDPASGPILRSLATRTWRTAFYAEIENETGEDGREVVVHEALRMWRNSPEIRFKGRLHEQLDGIAFEVPDRLERPDLRIRHLGYRPEIARAKGKAKRNRTLLAGEREGAFTWFSRASELQAEGDSAGALPLFDKAWAAVTNDRSTTAPHYLPVLALRRVRAARSSGDAAGGLARVHDGLERFLDHTELVVEAALCARALGALDDAAAFAQQARALGEAPARYAPQVGSGTIVPLGLLATIRAEQGRLAEARGLVTALEETYPEARAAVEAARAEVDAWQHAFAAAVDVFVGDGLPPAGVMPRVTGPLALALAACARPADGDARAFETLLEGLLDLERFEAFEQALGFWWKLDAPAAELHDRLAQIYLRRGFTEAARDEWLVAWEEERDARAVVGLARIEAGHGNNALAAELAEEARAFDAVRAEAEALLASLAA